MVGWELSRGEANLNPVDADEIRGFGTERGNFALDCNRTLEKFNRALSGDQGIDLPDPVAMAIAIDQSICTRASMHHVEIEVDSELTRGMTVVDQLGVAPWEHNLSTWGPLLKRGPNAKVCWEIDISAFKALLKTALR